MQESGGAAKHLETSGAGLERSIMQMWKVWAIYAVVAGAVGTATIKAQKMSEQISGQDRAEIEALYAQYSRMFDLPEGTGEGWADVFTTDGVFRTVEGRDALIKAWTGAHGTDRPWKAKHWINQLTITRTPEGAKGMCYYMLVDTGQTPPVIQAHGIYEDDLVKTPDGWKFKKRTTR